MAGGPSSTCSSDPMTAARHGRGCDLMCRGDSSRSVGRTAAGRSGSDRRTVRTSVPATVATPGPRWWSRGETRWGGLYSDAHDDTLLLRSGGETVLRSTDDGATWSAWTHVWDPFRWGQNRRLYGIHGVSDAPDLWLTGHMEILHSDDRGESWDEQSVRCWPVAVHGSADASTLWAVGDRGTILSGTRRSDTWVPQKSPTDNDLHAVFVTADGSHAWAVGMHGTIVHVRR